MDINEKNHELGRRSFLDFSLVTLLATFAGGILYPVFRYLAPVRESRGMRKEEPYSLPLADIPEGSAKMVSYKGAPVVIIHAKGRQISALSAKCTHLGCIVKWFEESGELRCPCHGAVFDKFGQVKGGPAPKPLTSFEVRVEDNEIRLA